MRLFNRLSDESRSNGNQEKKVFRGRKSDEGKRREGVAGSLSPRKLGMENLEERRLLSVNPIGNSEYNDIRNAYADLELPSSLSRINVIELTDLSADALQNAVDQAARTTADDLILLRATADDYVLDLGSTAINVNIDSEKYGSLTILGTGEQALTIETVDSNAFTVLNGDVKLGGAVLFNYSTNYAGEAIVATSDANVKLSSSLVMIDQATSFDESGAAKTSYLVDSAATEEDANERLSNATAVDNMRVETVTGDYNQVRDRVHATLRTQYHYFGYNPAVYRAVDANQIYDAESRGAAGWVGTVANMMAYTGWAEQAGFATTMTKADGTTVHFDSVEDAVAEYLLSGYINTGAGDALNYTITCGKVLDYLFSGNDEDCMGSNLSSLTNTVEGGGFFMDIDFSKVGGYVPSSDAMIDDMLRALRDGNAVTAEVITTDSYGNRTREYVSVWGYYYNPDTIQHYGSSTNRAADYVGLICSNPTKTTVKYEVTDTAYDHPDYQDPITLTMTHYRDENSGGGGTSNTYNTYLLERSGSSWRFAVSPWTYLNNEGAVQNARTLPEGFSYFGTYQNSRYNTYTSEIVGFSWLQQYDAKIHDAAITEAETLSLESMPGNTENVIYLYFGGVDGEGWDGLQHPALDLDGAAGYGVSELKMIQEVWARVAEDYAPFNVNVTTDPNVWANAKNGVRCVIGGYSSSAGGLSGVGSYGSAKPDNYVYPFSLGLSAKSVAEAAAHEIGHSLGLSHDGYEHDEYYAGNATWGPIMGVGYYSAITQWSDGSYVNATNRQDDVAIIASKVGFRADDFGNTIDRAEKLDDHYVPIDINNYDPTAGTYTVNGVIETRDDYDIFSFVSYGGSYVVDVSGAGADHRFIDSDFSWNYIRHADVENAVFGGKYYASAYDYANLNVKVELLDENGEIVLLDMDGNIQKLGYGETIVLSDDYYYYVVDQFGKKVYNGDGSLKQGYQAVDDSVFTTFSHFVTPELEAGKTYYVSVTGVGQGNDATNGFSDYGSLGQYTLTMHESYENFYVDDEKMNVDSLDYSTAVDNVLNWQEAFVYSGRRLEDGSRFLGNVLTFDASLSGQTLDLRETLRFSFSRSLVDQPLSEKRFVLDATAAWDVENDQPGITIDANEKFRAVYVDNTTVELYGFTFTGGVAETTNVIYLYFGGIDGTGWSGELHPAYDLDGDPTTFSDAELEAINEIYLRVAEDYAPFNVTVTTDQDVFNAAANAVRVVVGGTGNNRGGVAYVNSYGAQKQDCYVFPNSLGSPKSVAEAISHEVGHTLGLSHDGKGSEEYYGGTNGWAPIMGAGYYQALTQFSKGEYQGATQTQDDLAYIAAYLGYKADDHSDKRANATPLRESYVRSGNFVADGLIERTGDVDMFSFVATDSTYVIDVVGTGADFSSVDANGYAASLGYTNLDLRVELYDDAGNLLYTCDPDDSLFAHFEATGLTAGDTYYVSVTTTGRGNPATDGYSNYGALGQYYVTVAAGTLADFVGEERYESLATRNAVIEGVRTATKEKSETYGKNGQTNNGGGIYNNYGWLTIGDSVIAGNRALKAGGGIYNSGGEYENGNQHDGWLYLVNTSIVGNVVVEENSVGGGLFNESGAVATLVNVTIAGNTADYSGGGLQNAGRAYLYNTIVAKNEAAYGADVYTQTGKYTYVYDSIVGDESRNSNYTAYINGTNSIANGNSLIGTSRGSSVSAPVTTYDPKFVSYRDYDVADWSSELWKSWNLRLQGDSLAVDRGNSANLTNDLDFGSGYISNRYERWGQNRYFFTADYGDDLAGQPRFEGASVDAGAYEVLERADLTGFVPTAAGSDVVNDWESSLVISRAEDDQTGSIAPFLVDENLFLNLSFVNQGAAIRDSFETTVYMWKYDPKTATKEQMFADSRIGNNELALLNVKVDFVAGVSMPGGDGSAKATITLTNLATGAVQTVEYDGANSYVALTNVALGSIEDIVRGFVAKGAMDAQNEEGYYVFGYQLDSGAAISEYSETNNFYLTSSYFDVVESPVSVNNSIVVTTTDDVVDPYDGEISLREAVEIYAGSFYYREVALPEGANFESGGVAYTVKDGKFYVDSSTDYRVYPGESFSFRETVDLALSWNADEGAYVDGEGNVVSLTYGDKATVSIDGANFEALYQGTGRAWEVDGATVEADEAILHRDAVVTVVYAEDVYFDANNKAIDVPNGTKGEIDGVAVEMIDGVWTNVAKKTYDRDAVQAMGNFFLADGTEVAVVNGVFRRVATNDVAVVLDGATVTLANGESAVYDAARGVFVVTTTVEFPPTEGAKVVVDGVELTFVERAYVDSGDYRYYLTDGVVVTLANGYEVEYNARRDAFVFKSEDLAGKIDAGATILWNGETYAYKAGVAIVQKVSRETNAVVFDAALDGETFVLTQGELTLTTSFTLDCVDPNGGLLDLTIQGVDSRLISVESGASVEIKNFTLANSQSTQDGGVVYNKGTLTVDSVEFSGNKSNGGVGGSIYNASGATLSVLNSTFSGDSAVDGASIYNAGNATIQDSTFAATGDFDNGVVYNVGTLVVDNSQFSGDNDVLGAMNGGAIYNAGTADVLNSTFADVTGNDGGAIFNAGNATLRVADSAFTGAVAQNGGAIFNAGNATLDRCSFDGNKAIRNGIGGAIVNAGVMTIAQSSFDGNEAELSGGAIYSNGNGAGDLTIVQCSFVGNSSLHGGAIESRGTLVLSNSLLVKNRAEAEGGAILNAGIATLTNSTIADNQAATGGGLSNERDGVVVVDNSILAGNVGGAGAGFDIHTESDATTTLRSSLIANVAQCGPKAFELDAAYRSFLGVDPGFVDAANGDYSLSATSPAINNGSNALDGGALVDFEGNARRVGLTVGGVVMSVDMGAFEYGAIIAPDLDVVDSSVDYWQTEKVEGETTAELDYFVAGQDVCVDFNVRNIGDAAIYSNFGYKVTLVGTNDKGEIVYNSTQDVRYYASVFDRFNWLNESDWIGANGSASLTANLGALPAGRYTIALTLDVDGVGNVVEWGEEDGFTGENNNVYTGTFNVFEAPSVVVTTELDVVDPTDGLISLREAIAYAGSYEYASIFTVADGTQYVLENGRVVTVENGSLTVKVDVVEKNGVLVDLQDGDEFLLNGRSIYYRAQLNGGYFAYSMEEGAERADVSNGVVTFPDGTRADLQLNTDQYVSFVDGAPLNPGEGERYSYRSLTFPGNRTVVLTDGAALEYANVKFTYYQNDRYPEGAFVFENGSVVPYVDGGSLEFANLAVGTLQTRNEVYRDELTLNDGSKIQVIDGVARLTKAVETTVVFAESMRGKTIVVDATAGPIEIAKNVVIDGEDRGVVVDGADSTGVFLVQSGAVATISRLTATRGAGSVGGALVNRGELTLVDVDFSNNNVRLNGTPTGGELTSGLGGAIYNVGTLTVEGGSFENNFASEFGGAIFSKGELVVKNASFVGGSSFAGGAIAAQAGTLSVENTTFANNSAEVGGAVYTLVDATFVAVSFAGNEATNGEGGAIYAGPNATLSFSADAASESTLAVSFDGDKASGNGGAIYAENDLLVDGDLILKNVASTDGAALYVDGGLTVQGDATVAGSKSATSAVVAKVVEVKGNLTLEANESAVAAIKSEGAVAVGGDLTAKNNKAAAGVLGSTVSVGGDAILTGNEGTTGAAIGATGDVEIAGALTAENNKATASGAAIATTGAITIGGDAILTGNEAGQLGGSLAANGSVEIVGSLTASGNSALTGGAIFAGSISVGGDATLTGNTTAGSGGALAAIGDVVITGAATLENNTAGLAGGAIAADGSVEIGGSLTASGNNAQASGGAISSLDAVAIGGDATLTGNKAGQTGGAIAADGSVEIVGALTASDNSSDGFGGAVAAGVSVSVGGDATLTDNDSKFHGGAIYAKDGSVEIVGALTASGNKAGARSLEIETTTTDTLQDGTTVQTTVKTTIVDGFGGAIAALKGDVSVGGDAILTGNTANGRGGAIFAGNATFAGDATFENNAANAGSVVVETTVVTTTAQNDSTTETTVKEVASLASGGAIYADGSIEIGGSATAKNNAATDAGGAIYASSFDVVGSATLSGNAASDGGAIYADSVELKNGALLTGNAAASGFGGAIYARELALVGATVAGNEAAYGGGLYVVDSATIDNSIVAGNKASAYEETYETVGENGEPVEATRVVGGEGADIYVAEDGTTTLRNSLLQNVEIGPGALELVAEYRSILGVDPQFNDDYALKATSPAINAGSNALAGSSDVDLAGAARYVGLTVGGEIRSIDMGAFEYQTVSAPNLTFAEDPVNFWYATVNDEKKDYYIFGEDVVLDFSFLNAASTVDEIGSGMAIDKFSISFAVAGVAANGETVSQTFEYRYQPESDRFDWLSVGDWLDAGGLVSYARQNLGVLPIGNYTLTISLDVNNEIVERGEEDGSEAANDNVYTTTFEVREAPSVVVTTDKDVVDPTDGLISLREAVEVYAGSYRYSSTVLVDDDAEYVLDDLTQVVVKDGVATILRDVATVGETQTILTDGAKIAFGSSYMTFQNGVVAYPDGTTATYDGENPLTFTAADGTTYVVKSETYYDYINNTQQPVSDPNVAMVDVIVMPNGDMIALEHLQQTEFFYGETFATYFESVGVDSDGNAVAFADGAAISFDGKTGVFQNGAIVFADGSFEFLPDGASVVVDGVAATYVGAAFVLPNGEVVEFVAGGSIACENGSTIDMSQRNETVSGAVELRNGDRLELAGDGSAVVSTQVGTDVVFAANLDKATIKLDSAITIDRDLTIDASDRTSVSISGANKTNVFVVAEGATATIASLSIKNAVAAIGAGVANYGTLSLVDVSISGTKATSDADEPFADKILTEGVGGAIYNAGTLSVEGGEFKANVATFHGGAIYSIGSLAIKNASFEGNVSEYYGGAIYVQDGSATIDASVFKGNKAQYGGAVATCVAVKAANSIFSENIGTLGGAIYAWGANASFEATQSTLIANVAEQGGAIYLRDAAAILKNSIVATNETTENATDLALVGAATATVYASLIGVADDCGDGTLNFDAGTRSFYGTKAAPVDPALDAEGRPTLVSPALNSGSNAFATTTDGSAATTDVSGAERVVGVEKDGTIYSVDMGALECQTVAAPDLGFFKKDGSSFLRDRENPVEGFTLSLSGLDGEGFSNTGEFVEGWDVCFAVGFGNAGNAYCFESFVVELKTVRLDADGNAIEGTETTVTRVFGDETGYFDVDSWLASGEAFVDLWDLGAFEAGQYKLTLTVDAGDSVVELDETNNVFETNFAVRERPSLVVTTELDVVDPYDGETSLREAIALVGVDGAVGMRMTDVFDEGETFVLAENAALGIPAGAVATYAGGKITVVVDVLDEEGNPVVDESGAVQTKTVELEQGVEYALADGTTFVWQELLGRASAVRGGSLGSAISFAESVYGKTIQLESELTIDRSLTIDGTDANVVVSGADASRIAMVSRGTVSVFGLTFENGSANLGGAIYNAANLTLTNVSVKNSSATENGGAIYNALNANLTLTDVEIVDAAATQGGAIYNAGSLVGEELAISGADAAYGAGLYNVGTATFAGVSFVDGVATAQGGAIYNDGGEIVVDGGVENSSFVGNQAVYGGAIVNYQGVATIVGASFVANKATGSAGAIDNYGKLTLNGVAFENNEAAVAGGAIYNSESASNADAYSVALQDVAFKGNSAATGGAIYNAKGSIVEATGAVEFDANSAANEGGAIYNAGTATFATGAVFSANSAATGGAIYNAGTATLTGAKFDADVATKDGGAVANVGTFRATSTEFVANEASGFGGAIYNLGVASLSNSLVARNVANDGGAVANVKGATLETSNVTIGANAATIGGGVSNLGTLNARNTIVAANFATTAADLYSNGSAKLVNSLVGSTEGIGTKPTATDSLFDVEPGFAVAPVFAADGTLANGDALDLRLVYDSIAVDAGNVAYAKDATGKIALENDLDGAARVATTKIDMGAYEFQFEKPSVVVTTDLDVVDITDGQISFREAIEYAAALGESTVSFAEGLGTIYLDSTLELDSSITIDASAVGGVVLDACRFVDAASAIAINEGAKVSLVALTITNSSANAQDWLRPDNDRPEYSGGAVWNAGELTLRDATITGNVAAYGGGLYNLGVMRAYNSTIANNVALYYGGVYNRGELYVENSTIAGNQATYNGGGVSNFASATLVGTAIVGNRAETGAGVLSLANAAGSQVAPQTTLTNCTVAGNVATTAGGGVWANGRLTVDNSIVAGNVASSAVDVYLAEAASASVRYSLVGASNAKISGVGVKTNLDPNFVDFVAPTAGTWTANAWKAWNLELAVGSPAIDAGSNALAVDGRGVKLTTDLAGDKRVVGKTVDMGAYEEQGNVAPTGINVDFVGDLTTDALSAGTVVATLTTEDANGDEDVFTYELIGASDYFAVEGDKIVATQNVPAGTYELGVRSTDKGGKSVEANVEIVVVDPAADNYAAPTIASVANDSESALEVFWTTDDPAKEYVVSYRVGNGAWVETNALTGEHGTIEGDFNVGDVVQIRIRAVGGVDKNGSDWSAVETYVVAEPPKAFDVATSGSNALVSLTIDSNMSAIAYWRVAWGDGSETVVNELSTQRVFGHVYAATGRYEMKLFVNNDEVGFDLGVFDAVVSSSATLETLTAEATNVFSAVAPVAVESAAAQAEEIAVSAALLADETVAWNEIAESLAVETTVDAGVALVAAPTTRAQRAFAVYEALGAAFAEFDADEFDAVDVDFANDDSTSESAFDDAFLSELFGD